MPCPKKSISLTRWRIRKCARALEKEKKSQGNDRRRLLSTAMTKHARVIRCVVGLCSLKIVRGWRPHRTDEVCHFFALWEHREKKKWRGDTKELLSPTSIKPCLRVNLYIILWVKKKCPQTNDDFVACVCMIKIKQKKKIKIERVKSEQTAKRARERESKKDGKKEPCRTPAIAKKEKKRKTGREREREPRLQQLSPFLYGRPITVEG